MGSKEALWPKWFVWVQFKNFILTAEFILVYRKQEFGKGWLSYTGNMH